MKQLIIALALTTTAATAGEVPKFYDPAFVASKMSDKYIRQQGRAISECRNTKDWAVKHNKKMPIKLTEWAWLQSTEVACIDKVIEDHVRVDEHALPAGVKLEGRFASELRRNVHRAVCQTPIVAKQGWSVWVRYTTRFDRELALTKISQKSCKSYQFKREKAKI